MFVVTDRGIVYSYSSRAAEYRRRLVYSYIRDPRVASFYGGKIFSILLRRWFLCFMSHVVAVTNFVLVEL